MTQGGSKKMKIKAKELTGEVLAVMHNDNTPADEVSKEEIQQIYESQDGFRYVGLILHAHSSPGCWYFFFAGKWYKICIPQP